MRNARHFPARSTHECGRECYPDRGPARRADCQARCPYASAGSIFGRACPPAGANPARGCDVDGQCRVIFEGRFPVRCLPRPGFGTAYNNSISNPHTLGANGRPKYRRFHIRGSGHPAFRKHQSGDTRFSRIQTGAPARWGQKDRARNTSRAVRWLNLIRFRNDPLSACYAADRETLTTATQPACRFMVTFITVTTTSSREAGRPRRRASLRTGAAFVHERHRFRSLHVSGLDPLDPEPAAFDH